MAKRTKLERTQVLTPFLIVLSVIIGIYCISLLLPLGWALFSSLREDMFFVSSPFKLEDIETIIFTNYTEMFSGLPVEVTSIYGDTYKVTFIGMLCNSLLYSVGVSFLANFSRSMVAYVCARYKHLRWPGIIHALVIVLMTVAFPGNIAVAIQFYKMVGMYNNLFVCVALSALSFGGAHFLYLYAAYSSLSREYAESAEIDGANQLTVMFKIMMPMVKNIFIAVFILEFIAHWNDYTPSQLYLNAYPMLTYGLYLFKNYESRPIPIQFAGCMVVMLPTLILFVIFRNQIMSNLSIGGLKG